MTKTTAATDTPAPEHAETLKLRMHKGYVIRMLRERPEDWAQLVTGAGIVDAETAIAALEAHPADFIDEINCD